MSLSYTPIPDISKYRDELRASFNTGKSRSIAYRKTQLLALAYMLQDNTKRFEEALRADLGRPPLESALLDINPTIEDCMSAYHNVDNWAKTERTPFNIMTRATSPKIRKEPKGVVLVIGPFNFPVWCLLGPMTGAMAAGCAVVIKPSEQSAATAALITELIPKYLDNDMYRVVNGSIAETTEILSLAWDHILYTGSGRVGKIVATAAAKHLTPYTLELGGKSPAIVDPNADVGAACRRLLWGKTTNAGQICIAPDYVLVPRSFQDKFIETMKVEYAKFYPDGAAKSDSFSRIVGLTHFDRIKGLLEKTEGTIVLGGETDASTKFIAPTIVRDVQVTDSLMTDEIFGPILPIVPVQDLDEAISIIRARDHPLSMYIFTSDNKFKNKVMDNTQSGSVVINDVLLQAQTADLPFGGIGPSGSGAHTGLTGFNTFTHLRSTLDVPTSFDILLGNRFPPFTTSKQNFVKTMTVPKLPPRDGSTGWTSWIVAAIGVVGAGAAWTQRNRILA